MVRVGVQSQHCCQRLCRIRTGIQEQYKLDRSCIPIVGTLAMRILPRFSGCRDEELGEKINDVSPRIARIARIK